jgi:hypothetical protein
MKLTVEILQIHCPYPTVTFEKNPVDRFPVYKIGRMPYNKSITTAVCHVKIFSNPYN